MLEGCHWSVENPVAAVSLVHGFGEHCGRYEKLTQHLVANNIAVVGVDLRGHGRTPGARGVVKHYDDMYGDVRTLIQETAARYPEVPQFLFGHSMGGGLVLHHGMNSESDSLAGYLVSAPLILLKRYIPPGTLMAAKMIHPILPNGTVPIPVSGKNISTIPEEQVLYDEDPLHHNRLGFGLAVGMLKAGKDVLKDAASWNKPLRLWHSKADKVTAFEGSEQFASKASNCQFTAFDEVQHEMHQDKTRAEVFDLMVEFIVSKL